VGDVEGGVEVRYACASAIVGELYQSHPDSTSAASCLPRGSWRHPGLRLASMCGPSHLPKTRLCATLHAIIHWGCAPETLLHSPPSFPCYPLPPTSQSGPLPQRRISRRHHAHAAHDHHGLAGRQRRHRYPYLSALRLTHRSPKAGFRIVHHGDACCRVEKLLW